MNAVEISKLVTMLLSMLDTHRTEDKEQPKLDGTEKIAALKSAAATLEAIQQVETMKQITIASIQSAFGQPKS